MTRPKLTEEPGWCFCGTCGGQAFPVTLCVECDGGTVFVSPHLFDHPEHVATIIAALSDKLAERLSTPTPESASMSLEEAAAGGFMEGDSTTVECTFCGAAIPASDSSCPTCGLQIDPNGTQRR